jgi:carbonic anhydrase
MSIYGSSSSWADKCTGSDQSPINLSQSSSKPCDLMCELTFDDAYISQANVIVSDEGLILQSQTNLGSCKFAGESYTCQSLLVTHPSHHTIENVQADAEVVAIFNSPTSGMLCVSSLVRVNPTQTSSSHFFNAFRPYANPSVESTAVSLGEQWGLFMMVPPAGSYYVYDGSLVIPPCQQCKWVVFKSMINIDSNDFALLVKNVVPGSRPIQQVGSREVFFNDIEQLPGGPMPHDGKTYMRCKRSGKKPDVKPVKNAGMKDEKSKEDKKKKNPIHKWIADQISINGWFELINVLMLLLSFIGGIYYAYLNKKGPIGLYLILTGQKAAAYVRSFFVRS